MGTVPQALDRVNPPKADGIGFILVLPALIWPSATRWTGLETQTVLHF
jgi:hypothetical protein